MDIARLGTLNTSLPQEVLAVLPADPYTQLELAFRIICFAHTQRVAHLENDGKQLRDILTQKENEVATARQTVLNFEREAQALREQTSKGQDEKRKLEAEKLALIDTVGKMNRDIAKLEAFKRNVMNSFQDEEKPGTTVDLPGRAEQGADHLVCSILSSAVPTTQQSIPALPVASSVALPTTSSYSWMTSSNAMIPLSSPTITTTTGLLNDAISVSRLPSSPNFLETSTSSNSISPSTTGWGPPSRIDGKEFFRKARAHLSYEQFSQFLQNIKELNHGRQTRDATLRRARVIIGPGLPDLFSAFESLLNRHLPTS